MGKKSIERQLQEQAAFSINCIIGNLVARTLAVFGLQNSDDVTPEQREKWRADVEKADWLVPRFIATLMILVSADSLARRYFADHPDKRSEMIEAMVKRAEELSAKQTGKSHEAEIPFELVNAIREARDTATWN